jgi:hypothetical protein
MSTTQAMTNSISTRFGWISTLSAEADLLDSQARTEKPTPTTNRIVRASPAEYFPLKCKSAREAAYSVSQTTTYQFRKAPVFINAAAAALARSKDGYLIASVWRASLALAISSA